MLVQILLFVNIKLLSLKQNTLSWQFNKTIEDGIVKYLLNSKFNNDINYISVYWRIIKLNFTILFVEINVRIVHTFLYRDSLVFDEVVANYDDLIITFNLSQLDKQRRTFSKCWKLKFRFWAFFFSMRLEELATQETELRSYHIRNSTRKIKIFEVSHTKINWIHKKATCELSA